MSLTFYGIAYLVIKLASDAVNNQLLLSTSAGSRYCKVSIWFSLLWNIFHRSSLHFHIFQQSYFECFEKVKFRLVTNEEISMR